MGIVYSANDTRLNRPVALKMILDSGHDENSRRRFLREAQAAARVTHSNICRIYDIGEADGQPFLVMELLEGESMSQRLGRGPMLLTEVMPVTLSVLSALAALHGSSIVHRDLKPSNVFLSTHGVKLLDFGLAKPVARLSDEGRTQTEVSGHGVIAGTPRYSSPEQVTGKPMDARSDLFAAAAILLRRWRANRRSRAIRRWRFFTRCCMKRHRRSAGRRPFRRWIASCGERWTKIRRIASARQMKWQRSCAR